MIIHLETRMSNGETTLAPAFVSHGYTTLSYTVLINKYLIKEMRIFFI